jgi:hypothetical protein
MSEQPFSPREMRRCPLPPRARARLPTQQLPFSSRPRTVRRFRNWANGPDLANVLVVPLSTAFVTGKTGLPTLRIGIVAATRVIGLLTGPEHLGNGRSVHWTVHPRRIGLEETSQCQRPSAHQLRPDPSVIARYAHPAAPTTALGRASRTHMDDEGVGLVEVHVPDPCRPVEPTRRGPYVDTRQRHPHCSALEPSSSPKNVGYGVVCVRTMAAAHPRSVRRARKYVGAGEWR